MKLLAVVTPVISYFSPGPSSAQTASQNGGSGKIPVDEKSYDQTTKGIVESAAGVYQEKGRKITEEQKRKMKDELEKGIRDLLDEKGYQVPSPPRNLRIITN
jgi:hypothetical protein